jgi:hypothetical protein
VTSDNATAACNADEVMISALCFGAPAPLYPTENGVRCGDEAASTALKARLVCVKK